VAVELNGSRSRIAFEKAHRLQFGKVDVNKIRPDNLPRWQLRLGGAGDFVFSNTLNDRFERDD